LTFSQKKFTVIFNLDNREFPVIPLNNSQTALVLIYPMGKEIEEFDQYFTFRSGLIKIEVPKNYSNNSNFNSKNQTEKEDVYIEQMQPKGFVFEFAIKSCRKMSFKKFPEFYYSLARVYKSAMCIDFSSLNGEKLFGKYGNLQGYSVMNIFIIKCANSTALNKTNCYPEVINKRLSQVFISLVTIFCLFRPLCLKTISKK
jgi:hypothetical protein